MKTVNKLLILDLVFFVLIYNVSCQTDNTLIKDVKAVDWTIQRSAIGSNDDKTDDGNKNDNIPDHGINEEGEMKKVEGENEDYIVEICDQCSCNESVYLDNPYLEIVCLNVEKELNVQKILWPANEKKLDTEVTFQKLGLTTVPTLPRNERIVLISFYDNLITTTYPGAFANLPNVISLSLGRNNLLEVTPDMFKGLKNVKELDLSNNRLEEFNPLDFKELISLTNLSLKDNFLKVLPIETLNNIVTLEKLDCSYNEIYSLTSASSRDVMARLKELNLSHNKITTIFAKDFSNGFLLKSIDLSHNMINIIEPNSFDSCKSMSVLSLGNNKIISLPSLPPSIEAVYLQNNDLSIWPNLPSMIRHLDISSNEIYEINDVTAAILESVEALNVSSNFLSDFNIKNPLVNVKMLDFSFNRLEKVPQTFNKKLLPSLNELYIDGNPMKQLIFTEEIVLRKLSAKKLDMIESLDETSFKNVNGRLQTGNRKDTVCIDIAVSQCNNLTTIADKTFKNIPLCHLDISCNKLRTLSQDVADWTKMSRSVNLQGNPWDCDCHLQWLLDNLLGKLVDDHPLLLHELRCYTPRSVKGIRLVHWYKWQTKAFCNGNLFAQRSSPYMQMGSTDIHDGNEVEFWTTKTIILLVCIIVLGTVVVGVAIYLIKGKYKHDSKIRLLMRKKRQSMSDAQRLNKNGNTKQNQALITA